MNRFTLPSAAVAALCLAEPALAEELRPLSTDRPDITESPHTVDQGHFQIEGEFARHTREAGAGASSLLGLNLKVGILDRLDAQLVIDSVAGVWTDDGHDLGPADSAIRIKVNLFGNDDGPAALALMPWAGFPTGGDLGSGGVEGGLIVPFGFDLPLEFSGGVMVEGDAIRNVVGDDYHFELVTSQTVGHDIVGDLAGFLECVQVYSSEPGAEYAVGVNTGLTFLVTERFQLDGGGGFGVTDAAEDVTLFAGASAKF